jgi:hypothetical protein
LNGDLNTAAASSVPSGLRVESLVAGLLIRLDGPIPVAGDGAALRALERLRDALQPKGFLRNRRRDAAPLDSSLLDVR